MAGYLPGKNSLSEYKLGCKFRYRSTAKQMSAAENFQVGLSTGKLTRSETCTINLYVNVHKFLCQILTQVRAITGIHKLARNRAAF